MDKFNLIVEKAEDGMLWGRIEYDDNLIVDSAENLIKLEEQMKHLLWDFHEI